jgi:hypothetical protein
VRWDEEWFEVVHMRRLADESRVYVLGRWPDNHPIRNPSRYDEESQKALRLERDQLAARRKSSGGIAVAGLIVGHVPAHAQYEIEREYGFSSIKLSLLSLILPFLFVVSVAARLPIAGLPPPYASPIEVIVALFLMGESIVRFLLVMKLSSPWGSVAGLIVYEIWRITTRSGAGFDKRAVFKAEKRLKSRSHWQADTATLERDAYELRAPFLSLLSPPEQVKLHATFGFDPRRGGLGSAAVIGLFSVLGIWSSVLKIVEGHSTHWTWSSLVVAALLFSEQLKRLTVILGGRPAGSILGALVRPWCRRLLLAEPVALKKGTVEPAPLDLPDVWEGEEPDDQTGR